MSHKLHWNMVTTIEYSKWSLVPIQLHMYDAKTIKSVQYCVQLHHMIIP